MPVFYRPKVIKRTGLLPTVANFATVGAGKGDQCRKLRPCSRLLLRVASVPRSGGGGCKIRKEIPGQAGDDKGDAGDGKSLRHALCITQGPWAVLCVS